MREQTRKLHTILQETSTSAKSISFLPLLINTHCHRNSVVAKDSVKQKCSSRPAGGCHQQVFVNFPMYRIGCKLCSGDRTIFPDLGLSTSEAPSLLCLETVHCTIITQLLLNFPLSNWGGTAVKEGRPKQGTGREQWQMERNFTGMENYKQFINIRVIGIDIIKIVPTPNAGVNIFH